MLLFDPSREPQDLARALLALKDPVPALQAWEEVAPETLAPVLHALADELRGRGHPVLRGLPLDLSLGDRAIHLDLLLLPSIFEPEAWGMCFLEGLLRKAPRDYRGKRLVELGTGSGWVALALLRFMEIEEILGVDLNPQAVLMARLNAVLNGYDAEGRELPDRLASRFRSAVSDLLSAPREMGFRADFIIGCIPQVIAPAADLDSSQGLYDLSNYFVAQGVVEDQFGLGLNARALRESLHLLEPGGTVILNLAGRPGNLAVERMFRRRGFEPEVLWRTRVQQAADTDIGALVELESRTGSPFAFHLRRHSPEPVSARVAQAALEGGRPIFHELQVIEGRPRSEALSGLAKALEALGLDSIWEEVDLARASDEQLAFVTRLAEGFALDPRAPYTHEAGDLSFRRKVTDFLQKFHSLALGPHEAFAAPSRPELLHAMLMTLGGPGDRVVISASLRPSCRAALAKAGADPVWVHDDGEEVAELLPLLKPKLVVIASPRGGLERLLARCVELGILLVLDESDRFDIGSRAPENPGLAFLAQQAGSPNLAVLVGLIHSQAFPDVELALLFSRHPRLMAGLEVAAELSYSRLSCFHQTYYDSLFDELLSFRVNTGAPTAEARPAGGPALSSTMDELLRSPAFARPAPDPDVIRLDFGENELPLPRRLQAGILQGFLEPPQPGGATRPEARRAAADHLRATRLPELKDPQLILGMGTLPLLFDALRVMARSLGRPPVVLLPRGSYGVFPAL
ncbi:MAG TPA: 50S ribosomal protein L11 methyltransferase, partial [Holophagaceae bacterium]|nr:50S ribosomal protein L11 methyltransferase [Holophagaceae bacterium]